MSRGAGGRPGPQFITKHNLRRRYITLYHLKKFSLYYFNEICGDVHFKKKKKKKKNMTNLKELNLEIN